MSNAALEHLPSLRALTSSNDDLLSNELKLVSTRRQIAVVRTIADELERCLRDGRDVHTLREQFIEELAKLGCRSLEMAADIAGSIQAACAAFLPG